MNNYIRRLVKFLITIVVIFLFVLKGLPFLMGRLPDVSFQEIFSERKSRIFIGFLIVYVLIYPLINFVKVKRHLNGNFEDNRSAFEKTFEILQYEKTSESGNRIVFRKKSRMVRFIQWFEDAVEINTDNNPVIIEGPRKSVMRVNRYLDQLLMTEKNQNP